MSEERDIRINVPVLARVEGEGALHLRIQDGRIAELGLRIFEPPRLFEKFLVGRDCREVPDIVARICGICPVAYQMSAVHAIESVLGINPGPWVRAMRRLLYCGEWIESHSLHIHLLAAPDFLGFASAPEMAKVHPAEVRRGLRLQAAGNEIIRVLGGRSVHPVGVCIGGFHHAPAPETMRALLARLRAMLPDAGELVAWCARLGAGGIQRRLTCLALRHPEEYPLNEGELTTGDGLVFGSREFARHIEEFQVPYSTALHALLHGEPYLVGPLARLNLNHDRLPLEVRRVMDSAGLRLPSHDMFHSMAARAVEILYALHEAIRLLEAYETPERPAAEYRPRAGVGYSATEAPRGVLWHRYEIDADGRIAEARIVPPTSQNQACIEADLRASLEAYGLEHAAGDLRAHAEKVIRNYDPCISCATHFLDLTVERV
ncbi:MAG: Ni/Fe hydrogenase subunit alpha [Gammaproteobacteria bacterium]|nr:Ni/Fe hydrogenase subunit alpha [Gammaproteobacteria bacterium]